MVLTQKMEMRATVTLVLDPTEAGEDRCQDSRRGFSGDLAMMSSLLQFLSYD